MRLNDAQIWSCEWSATYAKAIGAGMIQGLNLPRESHEPTEVESPPQNHSCTLGENMQDCFCQEIENESRSRQIGIAFPSCALVLLRQWGLCPRVQPEPARDRPRGASLGDSTPSGAENSQRTHRLQATDDDGIPPFTLAETCYPSLCYAPSESSICF